MDNTVLELEPDSDDAKTLYCVADFWKNKYRGIVIGIDDTDYGEYGTYLEVCLSKEEVEKFINNLSSILKDLENG